MKRRFIDANALIEAISKKFQEHYGNTVYQFIHDFFRFVLKQIRKAPTIDAVEVVRCKECIHWYDQEEVCLKIYDDGAASPYAWQFRKPEDFCSYGERKGSDDLLLLSMLGQ